MSDTEQATPPPTDYVVLSDYSPAERLSAAFHFLKEEPGIELDGRSYTTVAQRVRIFRRAFGPHVPVTTQITYVDNDVVRVHAEICMQVDGQWIVVATGHAEEWRDAHDVNRTSALENAETSAIGRALANLGLSGGEFASADELIAAKAAAEADRDAESTKFLTAEEIASSIQAINKCKTIDELAVCYLTLSPALKVACLASKEAKQRSLNSAVQPGSEPAKGDSQPAQSQQPAASPQPPARSSGDGPRKGRTSKATETPSGE